MATCGRSGWSDGLSWYSTRGVLPGGQRGGAAAAGRARLGVGRPAVAGLRTRSARARRTGDWAGVRPDPGRGRAALRGGRRGLRADLLEPDAQGVRRRGRRGRRTRSCTSPTPSPPRPSVSALQQVGLLGARWVMEETFYSDRLARHGIGVTMPGEQDRALVDRVIFDGADAGPGGGAVATPLPRDHRGPGRGRCRGGRPGLHRDRAAGRRGRLPPAARRLDARARRARRRPGAGQHASPPAAAHH